MEVDTRAQFKQDSAPVVDPDATAREFANIAIEDDTVAPVLTSKMAPRASKRQPPELIAAEAWIATWRTNFPSTYKSKATPASLRAYALWHDQALDIGNTAAILRDPPLQHATVASYVVNAINYEKLPYDESRLRVIFGYLPEASRERYQRIRRACGLVGQESR